jgi:hypothetical protein
MKRIIATLNMVVPDATNAFNGHAGVPHCRLKIHLLPHGQGFRTLRPR